MNLRSIIFYIFSSLLIYFSLYIAEGKHLDIFIFWDSSIFLSLIAGLFLTLVNFRISEIISALKNTLSNKISDYETLNENKALIKYMWRSILIVFSLNFTLMSIITLGNSDTLKLGYYIAILLNFSLYLAVLKFFVFTPLEIFLEKKLIIKRKELEKKNITV